MRRPIRPAVAACRNTRRAATISAWQKHGFVTAAVPRYLSTQITSGRRPKASAGRAASASVKTPRPRRNARRPSAGRPCPASKRMASTSGSPSSGPADRTFRIRRKLSSVLLSISVVLADSPPCLSSSITIPSRDLLLATGCWKPSAGSFPRTSTRVASRSQFPCGPRTSWSRNFRLDSRPLCK